MRVLTQDGHLQQQQQRQQQQAPGGLNAPVEAPPAAAPQQQAGWSSFGPPAPGQDGAGGFSMAFPHGLWNAQGFANGVNGTHQMW